MKKGLKYKQVCDICKTSQYKTELKLLVFKKNELYVIKHKI